RRDRVSAWSRFPPCLRLLRGVVREARGAGCGQPDGPPHEQERAPVLRVLAEVAGDADGREARVRDLARPELHRGSLLRQRRAACKCARPLVRPQVPLVERAPRGGAHTADATSGLDERRNRYLRRYDARCRGAVSPNGCRSSVRPHGPGTPARKGGRDLRLTVNNDAQSKGDSSDMSITATSFTTRFLTWLLIAGLTGLLLAIGLIIG